LKKPNHPSGNSAAAWKGIVFSAAVWFLLSDAIPSYMAIPDILNNMRVVDNPVTPKP
jgi:hypothetical protein